MVEVRPFRGIMYTTKDLSSKITEPYDKITREMQERYYESDPHNFIRLNLPKDKDPYTSSRETLKKWLLEGIMKKDEKPAYYHYIQKFEIGDKKLERNGFFAIVKLEKYESKKIFPHERTFSGPKEDRLKMLRSTNVDLEPVFFLYDDPDMEVIEILRNSNEELVEDVTDSTGVRHILYRAYTPEIETIFKERKLVIADGHHRYETALAYSEEMKGKDGTGYIMAVLVNRYDPGLIILPSHRIIEESQFNPEDLLAKIKDYFEITEVDSGTIRAFIQYDMVFCFKGHSYSMKLKPQLMQGLSPSERLNVSILNQFVISKLLGLESKEKIRYSRWPEEVWDLLNKGKAKFAFVVKPVLPSTVWEVAMNGEVMPQKSTDFYPKLISGLEMYDLNEKIT